MIRTIGSLVDDAIACGVPEQYRAHLTHLAQGVLDEATSVFRAGVDRGIKKSTEAMHDPKRTAEHKRRREAFFKSLKEQRQAKAELMAARVFEKATRQ